jgi:hypothetical protein
MLNLSSNRRHATPRPDKQDPDGSTRPEGENLTLPDGRNAAAVLLGRLGGLRGGPARAEKMTAAQRSFIASSAAKARWNKSKDHST